MKIRTILLIMVLLVFGSLAAGGYLYYAQLRETAFREAQADGAALAQARRGNVALILAENQKVVKAMAGLRVFKQALNDPSPDGLEWANSILDHFKSSLGASACYLLDRSGNIIASTNRDDPSSFVGKNYSFRPCFQRAIKGNPATSMSFGVTSQRRGIHYSHPVYPDGESSPSGVVVLGTSLEGLEVALGRADHEINLLVDSRGIILASSRPDWVFNTLWKMPPEQAEEISRTELFGAGPLEWVGVEMDGREQAADQSGNRFFLHEAEVGGSAGWKVIHLEPYSAITERVSGPHTRLAGTVIAGLCIVVGFFAVSLYRGAGRELTKRRKAEEDLRVSRERYRNVVDNIGIGVCVISPKMEILALNRQMRNWFPRMGEGKGAICYEVFNNPPRREICPACPTCLTLRDGEIHETAVDIPRRSGTRNVRVISSPIKDSTGRVEAAIEMVEDITERMEAEEASRRSRGQLADAMDLANIVYWRVDLETGDFVFNDPFYALYRTTAEREGGYRMSREEYGRRFLHPDDIPLFQQVAEKRRLNTNPEFVTDLEHRIIRRDGEVRHVLARIRVNRDASGRVIRYYGANQDITERKQAEQELLKAKEGAEDANRMKSEFLANMSHEIRTPMNGIIGMTELALNTDLSAEQREYLETVKSSAESLLSLINDILDFSKIEAHRLELEEIDFDLRVTLENAMDALAIKAHEKGLELACHIKPDVPTALAGDPVRLRQVILNLAGNAVKFTEEGEVVIRVESEKEDDSTVHLHFTVSDTGIGIPADKIDAVFESFRQVDGSTTRKYGGTGLGLAISRQFVEMMGGRIWVESPSNCQLNIEDCRWKEEGRIQSSIDNRQSKGGPGTAFHLTIPFRLGKPVSSEKTRFSEADLSGLRVLIVDDNATNRVVFREMAQTWGLVPSEAVKGEDAMTMISDAFHAGHPYRLILLDQNMPGMEGFPVAECIKRGPYGSGVEIILLTSVGQKGDAVRCREAGIAGYLLKPVKQSELFDAIMMALGHAVQKDSCVITRYTIQEARSRLHILLAEDNPVNQRVAMKMLEKRGHRVAAVSNGKEALEMLQRERFDLVLMDVQMPEMDGFAATRRIRALELEVQSSRFKGGEASIGPSASSLQLSGRSGKIPIVAMTAHAMKGDRERCLDAGMDDYVSKPIKVEELFETIEKWARPSAYPKGEGAPPPAARAAEEKDTGVFDRVKAIEVVAGDEDLYREIAGIFLDTLGQSILAIREAMEKGDVGVVERGAHTLKGSVANFGALKAQGAALRLERLGKEENREGMEDAFLALQEELQLLEKALRDDLGRVER